jgi:hypothetical protein
MRESMPAVPGYGGLTAYVYGDNTGHNARPQLTYESSQRGGGYSYGNAYDTAGNPTQIRGGSTIGYNADNQPTASGYSFDGNGDTLTEPSRSMLFDPETRMAGSGMIGGGWASNAYGANGLRASKTDATTGGSSTIFTTATRLSAS